MVLIAIIPFSFGRIFALYPSRWIYSGATFAVVVGKGRVFRAITELQLRCGNQKYDCRSLAETAPPYSLRGTARTYSICSGTYLSHGASLVSMEQSPDFSPAGESNFWLFDPATFLVPHQIKI